MSATVTKPVIHQRRGDRSKPHPHAEARSRIDARYKKLMAPFASGKTKTGEARARFRDLEASHQQELRDLDRAYFYISRVESPADLIDWIEHAETTLHARNAADVLFGQSDGCTPVADRAHELASELAGRLMLRGKPRRTAAALNVREVAVELDNLRLWAIEHAAAKVPASRVKKSRSPKA